MAQHSAALRLHVESALAGRVLSPFQYRNRQAVLTAPSGIAALDALTGGLPRGCLTEICGAVGSGRTSVLLSILAARTAAQEVCALVDGNDSFDPHSAQNAGVRSEQLLWVRCRNVDHALRSADLLIQGGGFGLVALDLCGLPSRLVRQVPLNAWFRLRRAVEDTPRLLLVLAQESHAKTCASLALQLEAHETRWADSRFATQMAGAVPAHATLFDGMQSRIRVLRSRIKPRIEPPMESPIEPIGALQKHDSAVASAQASTQEQKLVHATAFALAPVTRPVIPIDAAQHSTARASVDAPDSTLFETATFWLHGESRLPVLQPQKPVRRQERSGERKEGNS
jgi:hypothetical protein